MSGAPGIEVTEQGWSIDARSAGEWVEGFRRAFAGFSPELVAEFGPEDVERLLNDAGIVRHRGKIEATILNARATLEAQRRHGSLAALVWSFEPSRRGRRVPRRLGDLPTTTPDSVALSKELRRLGFRYVGPTTAYAAMESLGLVNDHLAGCHVRSACDDERRALTRPQLPGDSAATAGDGLPTAATVGTVARLSASRPARARSLPR